MGSVKSLKIFDMPEGDKLGTGDFTFSNDYSVKDWGSMPDPIPGKGAALALMGASTFLGVEGKVPTHYIGLVEGNGSVTNDIDYLNKPTNVMRVNLANKVPIDNNYSEYSSGDLDNYIVPVEVITRRGLPKGSSVFRKIKRFKSKGDNAGLEKLLGRLGLDHEPQPGEFLPRPVSEFTTKFEERDRKLCYNDAWKVSGLSYGSFGDLLSAQEKVDNVINEKAKNAGMTYWDGKREYVLLNGNVTLADVAGTLDEDRFTMNGIQLSKEPLRQANKDTEWGNQVAAAKERAKDEQTDKWKHWVELEPKNLDSELTELVGRMYQSSANAWTGKEFFDVPKLDELIDEIKESPYEEYFSVK